MTETLLPGGPENVGSETFYQPTFGYVTFLRALDDNRLREARAIAEPNKQSDGFNVFVTEPINDAYQHFEIAFDGRATWRVYSTENPKHGSQTDDLEWTMFESPWYTTLKGIPRPELPVEIDGRCGSYATMKNAPADSEEIQK